MRKVLASAIAVVLATSAALATPGPAEIDFIERIRNGQATSNIRTAVDSPAEFGYAFAMLVELKEICPSVNDREVRLAELWHGIYYTKFTYSEVPPTFDGREERRSAWDAPKSAFHAKRYLLLVPAKRPIAKLHAVTLACNAAVIDNLIAYLTLTPPKHGKFESTLLNSVRTSDRSYRCHYDVGDAVVVGYQDYLDLTQTVVADLEKNKGIVTAAQWTYARKACPAKPDPYLLLYRRLKENTAASPYEKMGAMFIETVVRERLPDEKITDQLRAMIVKEIVLLESTSISTQSIEERAKILQAAEKDRRIKQGTDPRFAGSGLENFVAQAETELRVEAFESVHGRKFGSIFSNKKIPELYLVLYRHTARKHYAR